MKLSIIVPVYNMAADGKLEFCLESLVNQTIDDYEIIAVDDASADNSFEILKLYESKYSNKLRVIQHAVNKRQGGAKNTGLEAAQGEWIGFVDSDDWVSPDCYQKLLQKAEQTGADMVGCDYSLVDKHTFDVGTIVQNNTVEQTGVLNEEKHRKLIMRPGSMVIKIYKHDVIKENKLSFPEGIFYEDNCAGPVWSLYFKQFERVEEALYYYYQHSISTVHHISEEKCRDRMIASELFYRECKERGYLDQYYKEIEYRFAELYYVITLFSYMSGVRNPKVSFVKRLLIGLTHYFPEFEKNSYYLENTGEEEKRLISMQRRSSFLFFFYFRMKQTVRKIRKRGKQS